MNKKIAVFAFNGETMCFVHTLLYTLEFAEKGYDVKMIIEGSATKQVAELQPEGVPFKPLYDKVIAKGLIDAVCLACSKKMGSYDAAVAQKLPLKGDLNGHPSMESYVADGYTIMTF